MKRKIFLRISLLLAAAFLMVTCTKSDIEKAREAYDATKVVPVVQGITGATTVLQTKTFVYKVSYERSGSTWAWTGVNCVVQSVSADTREATFLFNVMPAGGAKAIIQVTETTIGGVVSAVKELQATVNPFCALPLSGFVGTWTCVETGKAPRTSTATLVAGTGDVIIVKAQAGIPGFFGATFLSWGESFQTGFGKNGDIWLHVNVDNGVVTINKEYWGQTLPGPYDYDYAATTGNWSNCGAKPVITISKFSMYGYSGYDQNITLTKL
jgi:hypothetical protein